RTRPKEKSVRTHCSLNPTLIRLLAAAVAATGFAAALAAQPVPVEKHAPAEDQDQPAADPAEPPGPEPRGGSNDECFNPVFLAGSPVTFFQNANNATTGTAGQNELLCNAFNTRHINNDEWFLWIANADGTAILSSCGGATIDTKVAVWN